VSDGPVYTGVTWATNKAVLLAYCEVDVDDDGVSDYDDLLEALFDAAKRRADRYLNNAFETYNPTIVLSGVAANDWLMVNGQTYTAAAAADEEDREFAVGATDSDTADNLCTLLNSTTLGGSYGSVGVPGITATNVTGTITLTRRYPYPDMKRIEVESADEDTMLVRQVRVSLDMPDEVVQWVMQFVKRHFDNRDALMQENISGRSVKMWVSMKAEESGMVDNFNLISHLRIPVGL